MSAVCIKRTPCDPFRLEDKVCSVCQMVHEETQRSKINYRAWATNMIDFLRFKGIEHEFTDWCGGWKYPGAALAEPATVSADLDSGGARPNRKLDSSDRGQPTAAQIDAALHGWFSVKPTTGDSDAILERSMKAALIAAGVGGVAQGAIGCGAQDNALYRRQELGDGHVRYEPVPGGDKGEAARRTAQEFADFWSDQAGKNELRSEHYEVIASQFQRVANEIAEPQPASNAYGRQPEPAAWRYDLATRIQYRHDGDRYDGFDGRVSIDKPTVPEKAIRNLTPLYAAPQPASNAGSIDRGELILLLQDISSVNLTKDAAERQAARMADALIAKGIGGIAYAVPDGYVLMPITATHAMTWAACDQLPSCEHVFGHAGKLCANVYHAMVNVAALPIPRGSEVSSTDREVGK